MSNEKKLKLIKCLVVLLVLIVFLIVEAFTFEPTRLKVSYHEMESEQIPESFDDFTICFFTDLHYGTTYNEDNISDVINKINLLQPDIILFGGDLVDRVAATNSELDLLTLTNALKSLNTNYGKYAVLGNHDYENETITAKVKQVLSDADFTIITNTNMRIHNGTIDSIRLVGLDSMYKGNPNTTKAFDGVRASDFSVLLTHTPDNITKCDLELVDLELAGHSHGDQVYLPIISAFVKAPGAEKYKRGTYNLDDMSIVHVSNGVGTTRVQARLFTNPEIVLYRLHSKSEN